MQDFLKVTGMVIGAFYQNDYDKRIILLTREQGKITAFVKGAKRPQSRLAASTEPFTFGEFDLYVGKNSYTVQDVRPLNYFEFLRQDLNAVFYGTFFLELADYYARENQDESLLLLLTYRALQGLKSEKLSNDFVKVVFEIKTYVIEGEFIPIEMLGEYADSVKQVINRIIDSNIEKLFDFQVSDEMFLVINEISEKERKRLVDVKLKSLDMLDIV